MKKTDWKKTKLNTEGYHVHNDILPLPLLKVIETHFNILETTAVIADPYNIENNEQSDSEGDFSGTHLDLQVKGSRTIHGDTVTDSLLSYMTPIFSEIAGVPLVPTYSFFRFYNTGQQLLKHSDRIACEYSATIPIAYSDIWPIWLTDFNGIDKSVDLALGDVLFYKGCSVPHWREPFEGEWAYQVFLHWVDVETAKSRPETLFDGRENIGADRPCTNERTV